MVPRGGIGRPHDDIPDDAVAAAFGVELVEHPELIEMMSRRWGGADLTPARRRMARAVRGWER